jgi:hypothetical protein
MSRTKRIILRLAIASMAIAVLLAWGHYECIGKYERHFKGMLEDQVISILGKPFIDGRELGHESKNDFLLGWYYWGGHQLGLVFKNGIVSEQWYGSK